MIAEDVSHLVIGVVKELHPSIQGRVRVKFPHLEEIDSDWCSVGVPTTSESFYLMRCAMRAALGVVVFLMILPIAQAEDPPANQLALVVAPCVATFCEGKPVILTVSMKNEGRHSILVDRGEFAGSGSIQRRDADFDVRVFGWARDRVTYDSDAVMTLRPGDTRSETVDLNKVLTNPIEPGTYTVRFEYASGRELSPRVADAFRGSIASKSCAIEIRDCR